MAMLKAIWGGWVSSVYFLFTRVSVLLVLSRWGQLHVKSKGRLTIRVERTTRGVAVIIRGVVKTPLI